MRDVDYSVWATEAAIATGLPVWVGISVERARTASLLGFGREDQLLEDVAKRLAATAPAVMNIMHTSPNDTDEALEIVRKYWKGPMGAYPEMRLFQDAGLAVCGRDCAAAIWLRSPMTGRHKGVSIFGGCCGIGPDHIAALVKGVQIMKTGSCLCGAREI